MIRIILSIFILNSCILYAQLKVVKQRSIALEDYIHPMNLNTILNKDSSITRIISYQAGKQIRWTIETLNLRLETISSISIPMAGISVDHLNVLHSSENSVVLVFRKASTAINPYCFGVVYNRKNKAIETFEINIDGYLLGANKYDESTRKLSLCYENDKGNLFIAKFDLNSKKAEYNPVATTIKLEPTPVNAYESGKKVIFNNNIAEVELVCQEYTSDAIIGEIFSMNGTKLKSFSIQKQIQVQDESISLSKLNYQKIGEDRYVMYCGYLGKKSCGIFVTELGKTNSYSILPFTSLSNYANALQGDALTEYQKGSVKYCSSGDILSNVIAGKLVLTTKPMKVEAMKYDYRGFVVCFTNELKPEWNYGFQLSNGKDIKEFAPAEYSEVTQVVQDKIFFSYWVEGNKFHELLIDQSGMKVLDSTQDLPFSINLDLSKRSVFKQEHVTTQYWFGSTLFRSAVVKNGKNFVNILQVAEY